MTARKNKFVLGTVQFGTSYGINNTTGQPSLEEAFATLDAAFAAGVRTLDTARSYGTSEDVIGQWIRARGLAGEVNVISKMRPKALESYPEGTSVSDIIRSEIRESLRHLGIGHLDGYLLHTPEHVYRDDILEGLREAKRDGLVDHIGISVYDEPEALEAVHRGLDYVQIPYNAFDQRLDKTDFFDLARKAGTVTFARSPFLKGLLLMEPERIPPHLAQARPLVERFVEIAGKYGLSPVEAALLFSFRSKASYVVFGAETSAQVKEILAIGERLPSLDVACVEELRKAFPNVDRAIVNPSLWERGAPDAIFVPSGGSVPYEKDGRTAWRSTTYAESDAFGTLGGNGRVKAVAKLASTYPHAVIVTMSHRGGDRPTHAQVAADELAALGVPHTRILLEEASSNTKTEVEEGLRLAQERGWRSALFVSNEYQLERIRAFVAQAEERPACVIAYQSAEEILVKDDPSFAAEFARVKESEPYQRRLASEARGVAAIKSGTYGVTRPEDKRERSV